MIQHSLLPAPTPTQSGMDGDGFLGANGGFQGRNVKSGHGSSRASLRDRLRVECINRLKRERMSLMSRLRSIDSGAAPGGAAGDQKMLMLQGFAKDVIAHVQAEDADTQMSVAQAEPDDEEFMEFMRKLESDLVAEMMEQEQEMVRQYLEQQEREDEALVQAAQSDEVICPVCLRGPLFRSANVFFCQCGMRLNLQSDQLSLEQLRSNIEQAFRGHEVCGCTGHPAAAVQNCGGWDMLVVACGSCDYMDIVA